MVEINDCWMKISFLINPTVPMCNPIQSTGIHYTWRSIHFLCGFVCASQLFPHLICPRRALSCNQTDCSEIDRSWQLLILSERFFVTILDWWMHSWSFLCTSPSNKFLREYSSIITKIWSCRSTTMSYLVLKWLHSAQF